MRALRSPKSDPQREAFYAVERQFHPLQRWVGGLSMKQARRLVESVRSHYDLPPVSLRSVEAPPRSAFSAYINYAQRQDGTVYRAQIVRCRNAENWTVWLILHEMAHLVVFHYLPEAQDHGPEFAGVAAWLYDHYRVIPDDALRCIYSRFKVRAISHAEASPRRFQNLRRRGHGK